MKIHKLPNVNESILDFVDRYMKENKCKSISGDVVGKFIFDSAPCQNEVSWDARIDGFIGLLEGFGYLRKHGEGYYTRGNLYNDIGFKNAPMYNETERVCAYVHMCKYSHKSITKKGVMNATGASSGLIESLLRKLHIAGILIYDFVVDETKPIRKTKMATESKESGDDAHKQCKVIELNTADRVMLESVKINMSRALSLEDAVKQTTTIRDDVSNLKVKMERIDKRILAFHEEQVRQGKLLEAILHAQIAFPSKNQNQVNNNGNTRS